MNRFQKLIQILSNRYYFKSLLNGAAAATEHLKVLESLDCNFVVDIGANRGQFALVARQSFPEAHVHSFEPLDEPAKVFSIVFANDEKTHFHRYAIGPESLESKMFVSRQDDSSSLLLISTLQSRTFPGTELKEERMVHVRRLDEILSETEIVKPAILKVDVQGYEKDALRGCASLLPLFSFVYVECSFVELYVGQALAHEVISFLSGFGFNLQGIYNLFYQKDGWPVQGDFLFKNSTLIT